MKEYRIEPREDGTLHSEDAIDMKTDDSEENDRVMLRFFLVFLGIPAWVVILGLAWIHCSRIYHAWESYEWGTRISGIGVGALLVGILVVSGCFIVAYIMPEDK